MDAPLSFSVGLFVCEMVSVLEREGQLGLGGPTMDVHINHEGFEKVKTYNCSVSYAQTVYYH